MNNCTFISKVEVSASIEYCLWFIYRLSSVFPLTRVEFLQVITVDMIVNFEFKVVTSRR